MPEITVLSYNLWFHKAFDELPALVQEHNIDVLCLQECRIKNLAQKIGDLSLVCADFLNDEIGLATYVNPERWSAMERRSAALPNTPYETLLQKTDRTRLQLIRLSDEAGGKVAIANTHIANLMSGKRGRRRQAVHAATLVKEFSKGEPAIMSGDFNYPFAERGLLGAVARLGFSSANEIGDLKPTFYRWPRRQFDRMFTVSTKARAFTVLPFGASDHAPILGRFEL